MAFLLGCEKVSVEFPTKTVFEGLSLGVDEGARIGIVGQNGDGKSTLLRVLSGDVEVDDGRVIRTRGVSVGVLGQSDDLRDADTVERAVVGDIPEYEWAGDPRVRAIIAGLLEDVDWSATVGTLSGGQRQRLTIARALVRKPEILILDDSSSALDFATDARLRQAIRDLAGERTVFIVSQRASTIQYADQILVLDDGAIVGMGRHEDLLESCEVYQEIYYSQFPKEDAQ